MDHDELAQSHALDSRIDLLDTLAGPQLLGHLVTEGDDHLTR